jgi:chromosome segregation ATPase
LISIIVVLARAMRLLHVATFLALFAGAIAVDEKVTPIEKVITLLEDMKTTVEDEGKKEAAAYDTYACFCKDTTLAKSTSVKEGHDKIDLLSSDIADKTQSKKEDATELEERKVKQEELAKKLQDTDTRCAKEKAEYEAEEADLAKAISSLKNAIKALEDTKPASLLSVRAGLLQTLTLADALDMVTAPKRKAIASLLQGTSLLQGKAGVDPSDPEYKYHSNDIIDLIKSLLTDFTGQKADLDAEYAKTKKACDDLKASLKEQLGSNKDAMDQLDKSISKLSKEIAQHRSDLVEAESEMKDDELYLKDLTAGCEERANDYDQRASMRANEISTIAEALKILKNEVEPAEKVNKRALLLQRLHGMPKSDAKIPVNGKVLPSATAKKTISFLQGLSTKGHSKAFLKKSSLTTSERKDQALALLNAEGERLGSVVLTSLAAKAAADPFKKVKGLIQALIERLLTEAKNEATKKGFCDTEVGKAEKDRDYRFGDAKTLNAELKALEAKEEALTQEIKELTEELVIIKRSLADSNEERKLEKEENLATIKTAKEGLEATTEALIILRKFYKQAAKAAFMQESPVAEDTSGPGFTGAYKGQQDSKNAVIALLETISSDFDRTIRTTTTEEEEAHRHHVEFVQTAESSIGSKTTKKELDEQDLETTKVSLGTKMEDLKNAVSLLDSALKELEALKPTCFDTGMSYAERVQKREDEIAALQKAVCILDETGVEPECAGGLK